jgi:hypothetical protein
MVRKWSTGPISVSFTTPRSICTHAPAGGRRRPRGCCPPWPPRAAPARCGSCAASAPPPRGARSAAPGAPPRAAPPPAGAARARPGDRRARRRRTPPADPSPPLQHSDGERLRIVTPNLGFRGGEIAHGAVARDAHRFPSRRWYPVTGATRTTLRFGICPSFKGHSPRVGSPVGRVDATRTASP